MSPLLLPVALLWWAGATAALADLRWATRPPLAERVLPYLPARPGQPRTRRRLAGRAVAELAAPVAAELIGRISTAVGVRGDLAGRLELLHSPLDPAEVRLRQGTRAVIALLGTAAATLVVPLPVPLEAGLVLAAPVLAVLVQEQRLVVAAEARRARLLRELPIVGEQLAMLLGSGYSLSGALTRIAGRGRGVAARDIERVLRRVRQGRAEGEALAEWAAVVDLPALDRLVAILALDQQGGDLGRLLAAEARSIRAEVARQLAAELDRRAQQVWIPVTVATLLPGTVLLAVPFVAALQLYRGS